MTGPKMAVVQPVRDVILTTPYDIGGRRRIFVVPPNIHLGALKTIRWTNKTGGPVEIWLAAVRHLLRSTKDLSKPIKLDPGRELVVGVEPTAEECEYEYHVFCEVINNFADGNSPPTMSCP
jgi:hypothetical protein